MQKLAASWCCSAWVIQLATTSITLKELQAARNKRRRALRSEIVDRRSVVEQLLATRAPEEARPAAPAGPRLKRYRNE